MKILDLEKVNGGVLVIVRIIVEEVPGYLKMSEGR